MVQSREWAMVMTSGSAAEMKASTHGEVSQSQSEILVVPARRHRLEGGVVEKSHRRNVGSDNKSGCANKLL
jgi:hypothetical protein